MTSRERIRAAIEHREPDRVPIDLGSTAVTGIAASSLAKLRVELGLDEPGTPVRIVEPYQMLGGIEDDLREALCIDTEGVPAWRTLFGFPNEGWRPWTMNDGTPVLVPAGFHTEPEPDGDLLMYPNGNLSAPPSGRLPKGGFYFDTIIRQEPIGEERLDPEDNVQEFGPICEDELTHLATHARRIRESGRAVVAVIGGLAFGDIALVPAPWLEHPRGIRDVEEWYLSLALRPEYVRRVFERQCEIGLGNLARIAERVGDDIDVAMISGTDFGTQRGLFASVESYRDLFRPFHEEVNGWIHRHTSWKTFIHSCGAIEPLIGDLIEAGFDILNPVQCSACGMDPRTLKERYGDRITFWGGVVDTQHTLPFGTPEEVRAEVLERLAIFAPGGGFVLNAIHNIQPLTPAANIAAVYAAWREFHDAGGD